MQVLNKINIDFYILLILILLEMQLLARNKE